MSTSWEISKQCEVSHGKGQQTAIWNGRDVLYELAGVGLGLRICHVTSYDVFRVHASNTLWYLPIYHLHLKDVLRKFGLPDVRFSKYSPRGGACSEVVDHSSGFFTAPFFPFGITFISSNPPNSLSIVSHVSEYPVHPYFHALLILITILYSLSSTNPRNQNVAFSNASFSNPSRSANFDHACLTSSCWLHFTRSIRCVSTLSVPSSPSFSAASAIGGFSASGLSLLSLESGGFPNYFGGTRQPKYWATRGQRFCQLSASPFTTLNSWFPHSGV